MIALRPKRPTANQEAPPTRVVLSSGALGFLGAAEDDRRRWVRGFRALLDGLQAPLQVVLRCRSVGDAASTPEGEAEHAPARHDAVDPIPPPDQRRALDVRFARALDRAPGAQRRHVLLVTSPAAAPALERAIGQLGVPNVARVPHAGRASDGHPDTPERLLAAGRETPGSWWDHEGLHRSWYVDRFPGGELEPGWLLQLVPAGLDVTLSWHAERLPPEWVVTYLQRQLVRLTAAQMSAPEVGDPAVSGALPAASALQRRVAAQRESAFHASMYLTVATHGPRELAAASERIEAAARGALCVLRPCTFRQLDGRMATLPLGQDPLRRRRVLDTSSLATFLPWLDAELEEPSGLVVGVSRATRRPVLVDPFAEIKYANANIGVFGHSGAGKTYLLSTLAMGAASLGVQVFVIDPEHEYGRLAESLGGTDVRLALGSDAAINVLGLRGRDRDEATLGPAAADAADLCAVVCGSLDEAERADVEDAARSAFEAEEEPVLSDIARRLDPASRTSRVLARWSRGAMGRIFSRPTTVDLDSPFVVFGMRELRPEMVAPVHFLLAEALWARIKDRDRRRMLVIDELGLLFEDATIRRFVVALARRIRKYHGSLVFATQNPGDLLGSEAGAVVASNPAIHFFGAQRPGEAARLQSHFELSDEQRAMLESARRGEFLLSAGADRIPIAVRAAPWQAAAMDRARRVPEVSRGGPS